MTLALVQRVAPCLTVFDRTPVSLFNRVKDIFWGEDFETDTTRHPSDPILRHILEKALQVIRIPSPIVGSSVYFFLLIRSLWDIFDDITDDYDDS